MPHLNTPSAAPRASFRRRLVVSQGIVLTGAFLLLGILGWLATYGWLHYHAWTLLHREAEEISFHLIGPDNTLDVYRYAWHEPHHTHREQRVDPFFVQVFDSSHTLLHASANTFTFSSDAYPNHLLQQYTGAENFFQSLHIVNIDEARLYYGIYPIQNQIGQTLGYLQIARYEPGIASTLRNTTIALILGLGALLSGLLLLTNWVAGRVVAPLQVITQATHELTPQQLNQRIPLPDHADRETYRLAETFNQLLDRIETSFKEIKRFTSNAAHELRTPLTVLRGHIDVALRRPRSVASYQSTMKLLAEEVDGMSKMMNNLLVLARLDRDQFTARRSLISLVEVVEASVKAHQKSLLCTGLQLETNLQASVMLDGHAGLLREAIDNVLDNAIKYTPEGKITITLEAPQKHKAILSIQDTGPGIPEEAVPHLTDRFYRAEEVQGSGISGSGLGLSIVTQIMDFHHGAVHILSERKQGTTVQLVFNNAKTDQIDIPNMNLSDHINQ